MTDKLLPCPEPFGAVTYDLTGCEYFSRDVELIERVAAKGSNGPTEVVYLYAGKPPEPHLEGDKDLRIAVGMLIGTLQRYRRWIKNSLAKDEVIEFDNSVAAVRAALAAPAAEGGQP